MKIWMVVWNNGDGSSSAHPYSSPENVVKALTKYCNERESRGTYYKREIADIRRELAGWDLKSEMESITEHLAGIVSCELDWGLND